MCILNKTYIDDPFFGIVNFFNSVPSHSFTEFIQADGETYTGDNWGPPLNIINYSIINDNNASEQWVSPNNENLAYVLLTFQFPIYVTNYTLKTRPKPRYDNLPKGWKILCSNDKTTFEEADSQTNQDLSEIRFKTYECKNPMICKYIKVQMTQSTPSNWHFHLTRLEFFGSIISLYNNRLICPRKTLCIIPHQRTTYIFFIFLSLN